MKVLSHKNPNQSSPVVKTVDGHFNVDVYEYEYSIYFDSDEERQGAYRYLSSLKGQTLHVDNAFWQTLRAAFPYSGSLKGKEEVGVK
jgi:hypothetical protein